MYSVTGKKLKKLNIKLLGSKKWIELFEGLSKYEEHARHGSRGGETGEFSPPFF